MAEAMHTILTAAFETKPLVNGPLGEIVYTDQAIFERRIHRILPPGCDDDRYDGPGTRWGVIFGLRRYPKSTRPIIFDKVLTLPMELVMSQSFAFLSQASSVSRLSLKRDQMKVAGDPARKDRKQMRRAESEVGGGEVVRGVTNFSLAVYGDTYPELIHNAGLARTELANSGAVVVPETTGNESAWWSQLPGNFYWRTRPAGASSRNWSDLSNFGAWPVGARQGRWGDALITFKTTAGTAYDFVPHVGVGEDVGMTAFFGPTGAGKTVILGSFIANYDHCIGDDGAQFVFDKDQGLEMLVRAMGGVYLKILLGVSSGMNPLRGLSDTPADRIFISRLVRSLIMLDDLGPIPPEDHPRISRAVAAIMRKPLPLRSFAGLRQYLGWYNPLGAGPRLERWCRGGEFGWLFDGERDTMNLKGRIDDNTRLIGFDFTAILNMPELAEVAAQYLFYLIDLVKDGRRVVVHVDEARFYIYHDIFRARLEDELGTGRKNEVILNLCAQQPEHLLKGSFGVMMVNQCKTKIALPNTRADKKIYCDTMHFTEGEYFAVHEGMHPQSHQFLIHREDGSAIIDFDLSVLPEHLAILSGRQITVRRAAELREIHGERWVDSFMEEAAE
jgi:type IV secretion system protein VirB4